VKRDRTGLSFADAEFSDLVCRLVILDQEYTYPGFYCFADSLDFATEAEAQDTVD